MKTFITLGGSFAYNFEFRHSLKKILSLVILRVGIYSFIETLSHAWQEQKKASKYPFIQSYFDILIEY